MKNLIISLVILSLLFALVFSTKNFALGREHDEDEVNVNEPKMLMLGKKNMEKWVEKHMEKMMDEMESINEEMNKAVKAWGRKSFFALTPGNQVMAGGVLENVSSAGFTLNTNGFKTSWIVATETKVISSNEEELSLANLQSNMPVRVKGKWENQNLVATLVVVLKPAQVQTQKIQDLLLQIINLLREKGIDVTPMLQNLQTSTTSQ